MRLTGITLQGFKSFSDRAYVRPPGGMTGIVGPNGCGKSNIIDALKWVLGESRASSLRGGALQDVLFNGSGRRPPGDWCMVEAKFAASENDDLGMFHGAPEIVVKRELGRDGQSYFFINAKPVRRRDVVDMFRGTGVSPRSYGVVEQGMVGSIAEASADELRLFLEETAGVSHYKDRRREAERRLASCRINLEQLAQLLSDVQRRCESLKRQARAARRHRELSESINDMEALLLIQQREQAKEKLAQKDEEIAAFVRKTGELREKITSLRAQTETARKRHKELQQQSQEREADLVRAQSEGERLQKDYQQAEEKRTQLQSRLSAEKLEKSEAEAAAAACAKELEQARTEQSGIGGALEKCIADSEKEADKMTALQASQQQAAAKLEEARRGVSEAGQRRETRRVQLKMAGEQTETLQSEITQFKAALEELSEKKDPPPPSADEAGKKIEQLEAQLRQCEEDNTKLAAKEESASAAQREAETAHVAAQSALETLESMAQSHEWSTDTPPERLAGALQADAGEWARALDAAMGRYAEAFAVRSLDDFLQKQGMPPSGAGVVDMLSGGADSSSSPSAASSQSQSQTRTSQKPLLSLVTAPEASQKLLASWLDGIYAAESDEVARKERHQLSAGEMLITREGAVFTRDAVFAGGEVKGGFDWQQRVSALRDSVTRHQTRLSEAEKLLSAAQQQTAQGEERHGQIQTKIAQAREHLAESRIAFGQWEERRRAAAKRTEEIKHSITAGQEKLAALQKETARLQSDAHIGDENTQAEDALSRAQEENDSIVASLDACRNALHDFTLRRNELHGREKHLKEQIPSLVARGEELERRQKTLAERIRQSGNELTEFAESALSNRIKAHEKNVEQARAAAKQAATAAEEGAKKADAEEQQRERELSKLNEFQEENTRLQVEQSKLRQEVEGLDNSLDDYPADESRLNALREQEMSADTLRTEIDTLRGKRDRLGAINFAADHELSETTARAETMLSQQQDVESAVSELQNTIRRIDDETRNRLRDIYTGVNREFGSLFQRLFGGGNAELAMDGESFLDAKFEIRARPPGKRMFPVRMLSGGEKSATALAFIFTLMKFTPPPFCLMDEVDATLDDARVGAFISLLKDLSKQFQCLVVTHNKNTIEAMDNLIGVTQEEKGVSKVVSVTLDEALRAASEDGGVAR